MYHIPDKDSIRKQLRELGYSNVPDEVLAEFVTDLEKLYKQQSLNPSPHQQRREGYSSSDSSLPNEFYTPHQQNTRQYSNNSDRGREPTATSLYSTSEDDGYTPPAIYMKSSQKSNKRESSSMRASPAVTPHAQPPSAASSSQPPYYPPPTSQPKHYPPPTSQPKHYPPTAQPKYYPAPSSSQPDFYANINGNANLPQQYDEEVDYADYRGEMYEYYPQQHRGATSSEDDIAFTHQQQQRMRSSQHTQRFQQQSYEQEGSSMSPVCALHWLLFCLLTFTSSFVVLHGVYRYTAVELPDRIQHTTLKAGHL